MKKTFGIICFLSIILNSFGVVAWSWSGTQSFNCEGCCVEDKTFQYSVNLKNTGNNTFSVSEFQLKNKPFGAIIGSSITSASLPPGTTQIFTLTGNIPAPTDNSLNYYICFYLSEQRNSIFGLYTYSAWECSGTMITQVTSKNNFLCSTDTNCAINQYCYISQTCTSQCLDMSPGTCGYFSNHKWNKYECCSNTDCDSQRTCSNHYCVGMSCDCGYIANHQCINYDCCSDSDCSYGQYCSAHSCINYQCMENKDCPTTEKCTNHNCISLNCGYCEHIVEHNCIKYQCCDNTECLNTQVCQNHLCEQLNCEYGFYSSEHTCKKQECMVNNDCKDWQKCENNQCIVVECPSNQLIQYHGCEELKNIDRLTSYAKGNRKILYLSKDAFSDFKTQYISIIIVLILLITGGTYYFLKIRNEIRGHPL